MVYNLTKTKSFQPRVEALLISESIDMKVLDTHYMYGAYI